jgi:hypothetical protein
MFQSYSLQQLDQGLGKKTINGKNVMKIVASKLDIEHKHLYNYPYAYFKQVEEPNFVFQQRKSIN